MYVAEQIVTQQSLPDDKSGDLIHFSQFFFNTQSLVFGIIVINQHLTFVDTKSNVITRKHFSLHFSLILPNNLSEK